MKNSYLSFNPLYAEINRRLAERDDSESEFRGNEQVIVGKGGYCYENGYINERWGYAQKYRDVTDAYLRDRVEKLSFIQNGLAGLGIRSILILTPHKAAEYERFIPDWYKAQHTAPDGYVRPIERLLPLLRKSDVAYIHCASLYDEIGLEETFPLTGTHWNKLAAFEATRALIAKYESLTGKTIRELTCDTILESACPPGFGNPEQDIFHSVYRGRSEEGAVTDALYYAPDARVANEDCDTRIRILMQGGSYTWDFRHYFETYSIASRVEQFYYNGWQGGAENDPLVSGADCWEKLLDGVDCMIFEANEQMICNMGGKSPAWGPHDLTPLDPGANVYDSLCEYLSRIG